MGGDSGREAIPWSTTSCMDLVGERLVFWQQLCWFRIDSSVQYVVEDCWKRVVRFRMDHVGWG